MTDGLRALGDVRVVEMSLLCDPSCGQLLGDSGAEAVEIEPPGSATRCALPRLRANGPGTLVGAGSAEAALPATAGLAPFNAGLHPAVRPLAVELAPLR